MIFSDVAKLSGSVGENGTSKRRKDSGDRMRRCMQAKLSRAVASQVGLSSSSGHGIGFDGALVLVSASDLFASHHRSLYHRRGDRTYRGVEDLSWQ